MTDKEKIRVEIEKAYNEAQNRVKLVKDEYWEGKVDAYRNVLCIFDFMQKESTTQVWHDAIKAPEIHRKFLARFADGKINGSWERHDDGFIPWKDVVREHKITHWCYVDDLIKL